VGEARAYTPEFLAAIDWALKPDEDARPQSVADFKRALLGGVRSVPVERTVPFDIANAPTVIEQPSRSRGSTGLTGVTLDRDQVKRIETELARRIGPIASVLVRNAAKKAVSIPALAEAVAGQIEDEKDRAAFVRKFTVGDTSRPPSSVTQPSARQDVSVSQRFTAETLRRAETALAQHIGAIARIVVKRAAAKARDEAELYLLISDEIKDPAERKSFIRKAVSISGKH
jgi:serine/threonine-protein kinase